VFETSGSASYTAVELDGSLHVVSGYYEVAEELAAPQPQVPDEAFKAAMRALAAGVVMVTTWHESRPWGLTISACCSVSVDPPQILISLRSSTVSCRSILRDRRFGVSILGERQKSLAELGSAVGAAKFVDDYCHDRGHDESPMIADALYHLDCEVESFNEVADHTVIVGHVLNVVYSPVETEYTPLLYFNRAFWSLGNEI